MSKLHKILIGVFCLGVLLCGLGTGLAFIEFTELSYGGMEYLGETDMRTENFDVAFEPVEEQYTVYGWYQWGQRKVHTSEQVPENTVRFSVTYNASRMEPYVYLDEEEKSIGFQYNIDGRESETALILEARDIILQNLKAGRIVSLDTMGIEEVQVYVNPKNVDDIRIIH